MWNYQNLIMGILFVIFDIFMIRNIFIGNFQLYQIAAIAAFTLVAVAFFRNAKK